MSNCQAREHVEVRDGNQCLVDKMDGIGHNDDHVNWSTDKILSDRVTRTVFELLYLDFSFFNCKLKFFELHNYDCQQILSTL